MELTTFNHKFPKLYHLTFASNLPGIREHGLRSTQSLATLYRFTPDEREATLHTPRRRVQMINGVSIRDQHTANESRMKSSLVEVTAAEWLALLNSKIFFFLSRVKAEKLADVYKKYDQILLEVDTAALLDLYASHVTLCRINSGSFLYTPRPRGRASFIPLSTYIYRNKSDMPAELTVNTSIPDILSISTFSTFSTLILVGTRLNPDDRALVGWEPC